MRTLVLVLGVFLVVLGIALAAAPIAVSGGDKLFLAIFWWTKDYVVTSVLGGLFLGIAGVLVFMTGVEMSDKPTVIPPPWIS